MAIDRLDIEKLDQKDPLKEFRARFFNDAEEKLIYLDGNSLGKLPLKSRESLKELIDHQWGSRLIRSWNEEWLELGRRTAQKIAKLVGAKPHEIFVGDSTSVNLYKLAFAALAYQKDRSVILTDSLNFPSDLYVFEGLISNSFKDVCLKKIPSEDGITTQRHEIEEAINSEVALLSLSGVVYQSAYWYNMADVNALANKNGSLTLWDLSHAVGSVPIALNETGADMAVGCTYKYLNGGPGAPAFLFVREDLQKELLGPIWGWFSHDKPFEFSESYQPSTHINRFAAGTPMVLSLAGIEHGVDLLLEADMQKVREKSEALSELFLNLYETKLKKWGFGLASPKVTSTRGSHISLTHKEGYRINRALIEPDKENMAKIIPDFRPPDRIRFGFTPLYTTYTNIFDTIERLVEIVSTEEFNRFGENRLVVP